MLQETSPQALQRMSNLSDGDIAAYRDEQLKNSAEEKSVRRLILLFDGTGNQYSEKNSNVLHFLKCLRHDEKHQLVYYQTGIATYAEPALLTQMALDAAFGLKLGQHVQDGYRFLMQKYRSGDKISLFGFSRGAYTARALCGFIQKVGLLPAENHQQIPFAWNVFEVSDMPGGLERCEEYKKSFSINVKIDFLGLWDTVASVGINGRELPFAKPSAGGIRVYRHALALDERRAYFVPNFKLTLGGPGSETENDIKLSDLEKFKEQGDKIRRRQIETGERVGLLDIGDDKTSAQAVLGKQVREVWFPGCHCDVGGGSVPNFTPNSLSRISLRWMIRECFRMNTGIIFQKQMLADVGFGSIPFRMDEPSPKWPNRSTGRSTLKTGSIPCQILVYVILFPLFPLYILYRIVVHLARLIKYSKCLRRELSDDEEKQAVKSEEESDIGEKVDENEEDWKDAEADMHDQLAGHWYSLFWWVPECVPLLFRKLDSKGGKREDFETRINLGRGRKIDGDAWNVCEAEDRSRRMKYIEVHYSVGMRIAKRDYKPRARFGGSKFCWENESNSRVDKSDSRRESGNSELGWNNILWVR